MKKFALLSWVLLSFSTALAEEVKTDIPSAKKGFLGLLAAPAFSTITNDVVASFGLNIGSYLNQDPKGKLSIGLLVGFAPQYPSLSGLTFFSSTIPVLAEITEREVHGSGFYFGARFGLSFIHLSAVNNGSALNYAGRSFTFAAVTGYEILAEHVSLSLDLQVLSLASTSLTSPTGSVGLVTLSTIYVVPGLNLKYRF